VLELLFFSAQKELLKIYEFNVLSKKVNVKTYFPFTNTFEIDEDGEFEIKV
jgi:hypothetical protein